MYLSNNRLTFPTTEPRDRVATVDFERAAAKRQVARGAHIARDAEDFGEVVARSLRDERERATRQIEFTNCQMQRPVSAADDDAVVSAPRCFRRRPRHIRRTAAGMRVDARP